jgi:hypothetical protein
MLHNALLLLLSVALSVGFAEMAVRLLVPVRAVGPSFTVADPVLGKRMKASFSAERITPEFTMRLSTNSLGFRGPEPDAPPRRAILFLGDSFTLGYGVNDGEEYPARLGAALGRRYGSAAPPVVNAGIGDAGNGFWVKFLRREAPAMQPQLVAMQLSDTDFADNASEKLFALEAGGVLRERPVPAPGAMRKLQPLIGAVPGLPQSHLVGLLRQVRVPNPAWQAALADEGDDALTLRIVEEAVLICAAHGWSMLAVLVGLPKARERVVADLFARHGVRVVVIPAKSERPDLYYAIDGHWHAAGHAFVAERLLEALQ